MTEREYLALPLEEQAAIVAEHVMGYTWWIARGGCRYLVPPEDEKHVVKHAHKAEGTEIICRDFGRDVPRFLTEIAAAWQVVARMQATGHIATTEIDAGSGFTIGYTDLDGNEYGFHTVLLVNRAPLAICMAALDAKGFFDSKGATA